MYMLHVPVCGIGITLYIHCCCDGITNEFLLDLPGVRDSGSNFSIGFSPPLSIEYKSVNVQMHSSLSITNRKVET